MSAVPAQLVRKHWITPQEYLAIERAAETRSEYFNGEMFAMAGASYEHTLVKDNLARETGNQLKGGPCRVLTSDMRVKTEATGVYTYPDIAIVCDKPRFEESVFDTLLNPRVLVEVLSKSTQAYDSGIKFQHYRTIPSLQEYILVFQDRPLVVRHARQPDDSWLPTIVGGLDAVFEFASIPAKVPLAEFYRDVEFPESPR